MTPIPKLADEMRIFLATEKMENDEVLATLIENGETHEANLLSAKQEVNDIFTAYMLPAEKAAKSGKLTPKGYMEVLAKLTEKYPEEWKKLRDGYEADGVTKYSERLNLMLDKYEEDVTILREMAEKAENE